MKPAVQIDFVDAKAEARVIANFVKPRRPQPADAPAMAQRIDSRLTYNVLDRVEQQIIAGDGVGQNLTGILNTTGIGSIVYDAAVRPPSSPCRASSL